MRSCIKKDMPNSISNDEMQKFLKEGNAKPVVKEKPVTTADIQAAIKNGQGKLISGTIDEGPKPPEPAKPIMEKLGMSDLGALDAEQVQQGAKKITDSIQRGAGKFAALNTGENAKDSSLGMEFKRTGALLETALGASAGATQAVFAPFTAVTSKLFSALGVPHLIKEGYDILPEPAKKVVHAVGTWAEENPDTARNLGDAVTVIGGLIGSEGKGNILNKDVSKLPKVYMDAATDMAKTIKNAPAEVRDVVGAPLVQYQERGLQSTYEEFFTGNKTKNARMAKNAAATAGKDAAGTTGTSPAELLAKEHIVPTIGKNNRLETLAQADELTKKVTPLDDLLQKGLTRVAQGTEPVALDDVEKAAIAAARSERNINAGTAKDMVDDIQKELATLRGEYGDSVPVDTLNKIKSARWGQIKWDGTRPFRSDANYMIGRAAKDLVESRSAEAGFTDVAQLNRTVGDYLEAAKFLKSIDGQVVKGGRLQQYLFQAIGSTFGNTIPGKIAGALGGDMVARALINTQNGGPLRRLILSLANPDDPAIAKQVEDWLTEHDAWQSSLLQLGPGSTHPIINQGRPIVAEGQHSGEAIPRVNATDVRAGRGYVPPSPAPTGTPSPTLAAEATKGLEPYTPDAQLPVIDAGGTPAAPAFPTIKQSEPLHVYGNETDFKGVTAPIINDRTAAMTTAKGASEAVDRYLSSGKMVLDNIDAATLAKEGGEKALIAKFSDEVVNGLKGDGFTSAATAAAKVDPAKFTKFDAFAEAIKKAVDKATGQDVFRYTEGAAAPAVPAAAAPKKSINVLDQKTRRYTQ